MAVSSDFGLKILTFSQRYLPSRLKKVNILPDVLCEEAYYNITRNGVRGDSGKIATIELGTEVVYHAGSSARNRRQSMIAPANINHPEAAN